MEQVLLGNVPVITDQLVSPPNPDGTYNIALPPDEPGGGVVAKETDTPTGENGGDGPDPGAGGDDPQDNIKKYLPYLIVGAAVLFFMWRKKNK